MIETDRQALSTERLVREADAGAALTGLVFVTEAAGNASQLTLGPSGSEMDFDVDHTNRMSPTSVVKPFAGLPPN